MATLDLCCFAWAFSSCGEGGYSAAVHGTLILVAFCAAEHRLYQQLRLPSSRAQAQQSWFRGSVAPWHVGSSWIGDRTQVSCIGRQILTHCTTREVGEHGIFKELFFFSIFHHLFMFSITVQLSLQNKDKIVHTTHTYHIFPPMALAHSHPTKRKQQKNK